MVTAARDAASEWGRVTYCIPSFEQTRWMLEAAARAARPEAEITALRSALKRHINWFTDDGVRVCGGCLRESPCPDDGLAEGTGQERGEEKGPDHGQ
jgi:hypothetical protein